MHDENMQQINYHCRSLIGFPIARDWFAPVKWKCNCIVKKIQLLAMVNKSLLEIERETHCKWKKKLSFSSPFSLSEEKERESENWVVPVQVSHQLLTWMTCSCCQFFGHEHRIWHRWTAPMCSNTGCQRAQSHSIVQLLLAMHSDQQF